MDFEVEFSMIRVPAYLIGAGFESGIPAAPGSGSSSHLIARPWQIP